MAEKKKFDPASLSEEQQEAVVEYYLGVHPKHLMYFGDTIRLDVYNLTDNSFKGFKPQLKLMGLL